jgi:RNase H-like domain found in reverse transcriptase
MVNTQYKVNWSKENTEIWEQFIESIRKFAITKELNENSQLVMTCNTSGKRIGGVLFQHLGTDEEIERKFAEKTILQKGILKIISIFSKKLNSAEGRYSTIEQELLAVVSSLKHSRHMILSSRYPLIILTDHRNLTTWEKFKIVPHRHFGRLETMEENNLRIRFIPGSSNLIAEGLSRICLRNVTENKRQETYLRDTIRVNTIGKPDRVKADRKKERQVKTYITGI